MCEKRFKEVTVTLGLLEEEVGNLKRKIRKLKKSSAGHGTGNSQSAELDQEYRESIKNSTSLFNSVNVLLRKLFTADEIMAHSVSGKAGNSKLTPKPKFDSVRLDLLKKLCLEKHNEATPSAITFKIQAVQKAVRRESSVQQ